MTAPPRETSRADSHPRRRSKSRTPEVKKTPDGLVFRENVRMLNGSGPLNEPMRVLYIDGSSESLKAYEACENAHLDFSVVVTDPGSGVLLHDRLLHTDFRGLEAVARGIEFARRLYDQMEPLIDEALPEAMRALAEQRDNPVAAAVEAEREERHTLVQRAMSRKLD